MVFNNQLKKANCMYSKILSLQNTNQVSMDVDILLSSSIYARTQAVLRGPGLPSEWGG